MEHLTTAQIKEQAHAAIRAGDRAKVAALTAEVARRLEARGARPAVASELAPERIAALAAQRQAIRRGEGTE